MTHDGKAAMMYSSTTATDREVTSMSALNRKDEFTEPVLTDTPAWWASMDVPGVNVVRKGMTSITEAFEQYVP